MAVYLQHNHIIFNFFQMLMKNVSLSKLSVSISVMPVSAYHTVCGEGSDREWKHTKSLSLWETIQTAAARNVWMGHHCCTFIGPGSAKVILLIHQLCPFE